MALSSKTIVNHGFKPIIYNLSPDFTEDQHSTAVNPPLEADRITFNALISACEKCHAWSGLVGVVFEEVRWMVLYAHMYI